MIGELLARFLLGGAIVAAFSVIGEIFETKAFAGLFGAAPSVAIATLGLAFHKHGAAEVATSARSMAAGCAALFVYAMACVFVSRKKELPIWLGAGLSYGAWIAVAFASWKLLTFGGLR